MSEDAWRPLGFEGDEAATYDALHDGIPAWMAESFWGWMRRQLVGNTDQRLEVLRLSLIRDLERVCRLDLGRDLRSYVGSDDVQWKNVRFNIEKADAAFRVADYLLTLKYVTAPDTLDKVLHESGSAWKVGQRAGRPGLVKRVPEGVQAGADAAMASSGQAGVRLAQAWERVFGVSPDPTGAYALAVRAVEDAAIPVVVPKQSGATLGHVIGQLAKDGDWSLPFSREDENATTASIVLAQCRALWKGHHDRHGGVEGAGSVSQEEAETAVTLAVSLVQWFASGMVARR